MQGPAHLPRAPLAVERGGDGARVRVDFDHGAQRRPAAVEGLDAGQVAVHQRGRGDLAAGEEAGELGEGAVGPLGERRGREIPGRDCRRARSAPAGDGGTDREEREEGAAIEAHCGSGAPSIAVAGATPTAMAACMSPEVVFSVA